LYTIGKKLEIVTLLYAAKYAEQCSLCSCPIPTFSKFMYSSSTGFEHSFGGIRISLHLLVLSLIWQKKYIYIF